jgi:hypothetical protein
MARRRCQTSKPFKEGTLRWLLRWQDEFDSGVRTRKRKRVKLAPQQWQHGNGFKPG